VLVIWYFFIRLSVYCFDMSFMSLCVCVCACVVDYCSRCGVS
jgi:hypothetical protein